MSNQDPMSAERRDYYTPEDLKRLWDPNWLQNMFSLSAWYQGRDPIPSIDPLFDNYHPYACDVCKRGPFSNGTKISVCSRCRVVQYCCREHQKEHWPQHKKWCKTYEAALKLFPEDMPPPRDIESWRNYSRVVMGLMDRTMASDLPFHSTARQIVALQPRCRKCFRAGSNGAELHVCPKCCGVALCDKCWKKGANVADFHCSTNSPYVECETLTLAMAATGMVVEQGNPLAIPSKTDCKERWWVPKDWHEYFARKRTDFGVEVSTMSQMAPVTAFLTAGISVPLLLHMVLHKHMRYYEKNKSKKLVVHLVGAKGDDYVGTARYIELTRLNPQLKLLHIILIGPTVSVDGKEPIVPVEQTHEYRLRTSCEAWMECHKGIYHDLASTLPEPTIVLCPAAGVSEPTYTATWESNFSYIKEKKLPCVITGYDIEEVKRDVRHIQRWGLDVTVSATPNPFRGLRPHLDAMRDPQDVMYEHSAYAVINGGEFEE